MESKRKNWWQDAQTFLIVGVVAVLIWLYAETNTLQEETINPLITFEQLETFIPNAPEPVLLRFKCPTGRISAVKDLLPLFTLPVDDTPHDDPHRVISLKQALAAYEPLVKLGVSIMEVNPDTATIDVYRLVTKELSLETYYDGNMIEGSPNVIEPDIVQVTLPTPVWEVHGDFPMEVRIEQSDLDRAATPNFDDLISIRLPLYVGKTLPDGFIPIITPHDAMVQFAKKENPPFKLPPVQVHVSLPADKVGKYAIEFVEPADEFKSGIELSGPPDIIDNIKDNPSQIRIYVWLGKDDIHKQEILVNPKIDLPDGVRHDNPPVPSVKLSITLLNSRTPPPPELPGPEEQDAITQEAEDASNR